MSDRFHDAPKAQSTDHVNFQPYIGDKLPSNTMDARQNADKVLGSVSFTGDNTAFLNSEKTKLLLDLSLGKKPGDAFEKFTDNVYKNATSHEGGLNDIQTALKGTDYKLTKLPNGCAEITNGKIKVSFVPDPPQVDAPTPVFVEATKALGSRFKSSTEATAAESESRLKESVLRLGGRLHADNPAGGSNYVAAELTKIFGKDAVKRLQNDSVELTVKRNEKDRFAVVTIPRPRPMNFDK